MKLFANGCSFTFGGGLYSNFEETGHEQYIHVPGSSHLRNVERERVTWPGQLGQLIGATEVVNLALGAASNARIARTTLDYFYEKMDQGEDVTDYLAVIQWSDISRNEYYAHGNWWLLNNNGVCNNTGYKAGNLPADGLVRHQLHNAEYFFKNLNSDEQDVYNAVMQVTALGGFFEKFKIPYVFWTMNGLHYDVLDERKYLLGIEKFNWLFHTVNDSRFSCFASHDPDCFVSPTDGHPNEKGHAIVGERLRDQLRVLGLVT